MKTNTTEGDLKKVDVELLLLAKQATVWRDSKDFHLHVAASDAPRSKI